MIDFNQLAPDFRWLDAAGKARSLQELRDRSRVVVLFARDEATAARDDPGVYE